MTLAILFAENGFLLDQNKDQEFATLYENAKLRREEMTGLSVGRISINEKTPSSNLQLYVEERVKEWLVSQELATKGPADYEVAFFDEATANKEVSCLITVQAGETQWRSWETGENPQVALNRSLENLHIDMKH